MAETPATPVSPRPVRFSWTALIAALAVAAALITIAAQRPNAPGLTSVDGFTALQSIEQVRHVTLFDQDSREVGADLFESRWSLVFFGYTACPDICPTTLAVLRDVSQRLGDSAPRVVLVSVDGARDGPARLKSYVGAFDPSFVALTGAAEDVRSLADQLHVIFRPVADSGQVDHSTHIALIDRDRRFVGYFSVPHRAGTISATLRALM